MERSFNISPSKVALLDFILKAPHGERGMRQKAILDIVCHPGDRETWRRQLRYEREKGIPWQLNEERAQRLAQLLGESGNWRSFIRGLHPTKHHRRKIILPGERGRAEISCDILSDKNLLDGHPDPVSSRIQIYIDEVYFPQRFEDGHVEEKGGHFISIQPTAPYSDGAITLIVDHETPRALLISQYRYNAQGYMTEACRGFGDPDDVNEEHTSRREREEETSITSERVKKRKRMGYVHTDSGKLMEMPGYFLEFVDAAIETEERTKMEAAMEDPVWVDLKQLYRAIIQQSEVTLKPDSDNEKGEFEFLFSDEARLQMNTRAPISHGTLEINDSFTIVSLSLAVPHICAHYNMTTSDLFGI